MLSEIKSKDCGTPWLQMTCKVLNCHPLLMAFHGFSIRNWLTISHNAHDKLLLWSSKVSGSIGSSESSEYNVQNAIRTKFEPNSNCWNPRCFSRDGGCSLRSTGGERSNSFILRFLRFLCLTSTAHLKWFRWSFGLYLDIIEVWSAGI